MKLKYKIKAVLAFWVLVFLLNGCYALRKKFVRKRKHNIPPPVYLNLKNYPKVPTKEMYDDYYVFVKGWLDELVRCMENDYGKKRQKKSINEAIENLKQIAYFFTPAGKEKIQPLYEGLVSLKEKVSQPYLSYSEKNYIVRKAERLKREFERDFTYEKAKQWLRQE